MIKTITFKKLVHHTLLLGLLMIVLPLSLYAQTTRYVNSSTGNDANTGLTGSPVKTIQKAVDLSSASNIIEVASGNYNELVVVNKKLTLKGVGASKPKVNYTGGVGTAIFQITADEVEIDNFEMNVDLTKLSSGIVVVGAVIDKLTITNNTINPVASSSAAATTFGLRNAISINYATNRVATGGVDNIIVTNNTVTATINDGFGGQRLFRSAISVDEGNSVTFTGNDFAGQNHDITLRFNNGGDVLIQNNFFRGGGVEIGSHNSGAGKVDILNNTFNSIFASLYTSSMRLQYNNQGKQTNISGNTFANHNWGISLENYKSVTINNNTFTPLANSTTYRHITVNTKVLVTDVPPISQTAIDGIFTNNIFNGSGTTGGSALAFYNHDDANDTYGTFVIGSTGNENTFNDGIANYILLGNETGSTSALNASYGYTGLPSTTAACWTQDLNAEFNKYNVGSGAKLPTAMTGAERTTLETKIYHKPDASCLARVVTFLPINNTTQATSYVTIAEAILAANPNDVLVVSPGNYSEDLTINKPLTINGANVGKLGTDNTRGDESIILNGKMNITATGVVVIDGFKFMRNDALVVDVVIVGGGTTATITNNIFERNGSATGTIARAVTTSAGSAVKTISNNLFTGTTSGGLFGGHKTWNNAMYVNGATGTVNIQNNTFENNRTALNIDDHQAGIKVDGNTFNNNGTHMSFGGVTPTTGSYTLDANNFKQTFTFINLSNVADNFRLDITSSSYSGTPIASATDATLFTIEAQMVHKGISGKKGKVIYKANNQYVNNFTTPATKIDLIQNSVKYADANDIINLQGGTYNQRVLIDKSDVTLQGIDADETLQIMSGTGLAGNGDGIQIANGIKNVTIKQLTIQNFNGAGGNADAGIYAIGGNDGLKVDDVAIKNNVGGSGIYANGPVDGVSITNSLVEGHSTGARGIVIWNGFKQNITITGNTVKNNNCCGIELQDGSASGVTISNNIVTDNGDSGIGLTGLTGPLANLISNNTVTNNGRFGIEVKNASGSGAISGPGSIVVDRNTVTRTVAITDLRDIAGIAVFRRGVLGTNVDVPYGVVVSNNTVSGFTQASDSDGFGIVAEGINHQINNNTVTGNDVGIQRQAGHSPYPADGNQNNLPDQYFGRGNSPVTCGVTLTSNTLSGNATDTRDVGNSDGTGVVVNTNSGKPFCSIQTAINDVATVNGHVIEVAAGTYAEDITVNKELDIRGPNYSISPNGGTRVAEAIIVPATAAISTGEVIHVAASNVSIKGFTINGDNPLLTSGFTSTNGADIDAAEGVTIYEDNLNNLKIQNNIFKNLSYYGVTLFGASYSAPASSGHLIDDNLFKDMGTYDASSTVDKWGGGVLLYNSQYAHVINNVMTNVRMGIQTGNFHNANPGNLIYQVFENNNIQARRTGIFFNLHTGPNVAPMTVSNNTINAIPNVNEPKWNGLLLASLSDAAGTVNGNIINGTGTDIATTTVTGIEVWHVKSDAPVAISGGTISNVNTGIFLNNFEGYNGDASNGAHATISGVTITPNTTGVGIRVLDSPSSTTHAAVEATIGAGVKVVGGKDGLVVENTSAKVNSPTGNIEFTTPSGSYIKMVANANNFDATTAIFDGKTGATATLVENFTIEDKITHKIDNNALGFVLVKANNDFVTTNSGTIQQGINAASDGFQVNVGPGTFTENVTVNKFVKIKGTGNSTIVQGVGNAGNLFTYQAAGSGVDGLNKASIEGLKLTKAAVGIYTNLLANFVTLKDLNFDALTAYGIQINTPTSGVLNDWSIQNGVFNAITGSGIQIGTNAKVDKLSITNSTFANNSTPLYFGQNSAGTGSLNDVTITGSTFTNNGVLNNQAAIYIEKLSNAKISGNTFTDNGISTNPRAMIINLKYKDYTNIEISDNKMSETRAATATGGYGLQLAARNDAPSYSTLPASLANVTISGNEITNFQSGVGLENNVDWNSTTVSNNSIANANTALYGLGARTGLTLQVHNNSFVNSTTNSLANGVSGSSINADCNWFGTTSSSEITAKVAGNVTFIPFLTNGTDDNLTTTGFQPVPGSCIGTGPVKLYTDNTLATLTSSFFTIQAAVNAATSGNAIVADAGTFNEFNINVNKSLTINGANANVTCTGTRNPESIVQNLANNGSPVFIINANGVTLNGLEIINPYGNSAIDAGATGPSNLTIKNNKIHNVGTSRGSGNVYAVRYLVGSGTTTDVTISDNCIYDVANTTIALGNSGGIWFGQSTSTGTVSNVMIERNNISNVNAIAIKSAWGITIGVGTTGLGSLIAPIIRGNTITSITAGYPSAIDLTGKTPNAIVTNNTIDNINSTATTPFASGVTVGNLNTGATTLVINDNSITNVQYGITNGNTAAVNATCNWYGNVVPATVNSKIAGPVTFLPFLVNGTDDNLTTLGFQPVPGSCTGTGPVKLYTDNTLATLTSSFFKIQDAVDAASTGNAIVADAGTYNEQVNVNKALTILGPNNAISPNTGTRVAEAVLTNTSTGRAFSIQSGNTDVVISGFKFDGGSPIHDGNDTGNPKTSDVTFSKNLVINANAIYAGTCPVSQGCWRL